MRRQPSRRLGFVRDEDETRPARAGGRGSLFAEGMKNGGEENVEQEYFLARTQEELRASIAADCRASRIIHLDLAKRYGVKAAEAADQARISITRGICDDSRLRFVA